MVNVEATNTDKRWAIPANVKLKPKLQLLVWDEQVSGHRKADVAWKRKTQEMPQVLLF